MGGRIITPEEALTIIPQQEPFRFVDELLELDGEGAVGRYTWRPDHDFYRGHFPGNPVTPGVLLVECMAQCAVVPIAIYLFFEELGDEARKLTTLFTESEIEFSGMVRPGETVTVTAKKLYFRRRKLKVEAEMKTEDGSVVCSGTLAGLGVIG